MSNILGHFFEQINASKETEHLRLDFSVSPKLLKECWSNNSQAAEFLSHYVPVCFPSVSKKTTGIDIDVKLKEIKDAISFIVNELLENSMKYALGDRSSKSAISIYFHQQKIIIETENYISKSTAKKYQQAIQPLLDKDSSELLLERLEAQANNEIIGQLGLITILNDYPTTLGWKFETLSNDTIKINTQVQMGI